MNLRPKTKSRLAILLIAGIAAMAALSALVVFRLHRYEQGRLVYRAEAMSAYQHADYRTAAVDFSKYLSNDRVDPEAIYALAVCRTKLPRADLGHLLDAKNLFTRYLELKPGDLEAEHQLLDIYQKLGAAAESMTIADSLLAINPDDVVALSAKLQQLDRDQNYSDALPISMRLNELTPLDIRTQVTTLGLMSHLRRPAGDIVGRADRLLAVHARDPRFQFLRAAAAFFTNDLEGTKKWLHTAAAGTPPDADFILVLANGFDKLGMWSDSRILLEKAAAAPNAPNEIKASLAQRLFELDEFDAALTILKDVKPSDPTSDSRLLGLTGLMFFARDHPAKEHPSAALNTIVSALEQRSDGDLLATAWHSLLQALTNDSPAGLLQDIRLCRTAARLDPDSADARFYLGMEYLRLGEGELSLQCLRQTTQLQPEWAAPYIIIARTLMQRGQAAQAAIDAQAACDRSPHSIAAQVACALALYAALRPTATGGDIQPLLTYITQVRAVAGDDPQLLAAEIDLLARSDRRSEATALVISTLKTSVSPAALWQIEEIDRTDHLDLASPIAERAARCDANTPESALQQIQVLATAGRAEMARRALPLMEAHQTVDWKIAWLQAREALGDSGVALAWELFADSLSHNLQVQQAAMHSPAVNANRALMDRTIDRLKNLTGDDALEWKLNRARWQLAATEDIKNNANSAAAAMAEVVRLAPQYVAPQIIWADALMKLGDDSAAISHLRYAGNVDPVNPAVSLKLAKVLMDQGQTQDAISLLNGMVNSSYLSPGQRVDTARLYHQAGAPVSAISLLKDELQIHPNDPARDLLLAQLFAQRGDPAAAADIYDALMQQAGTTAAVVRASAWFAASRGQMDRAHQCLLRLNELPLPAGEKEIVLGQFEAAFGTKAAAATQYQSATRAAPKSSRPWLMWAGLELRNRDFTAAVKIVNDGLKNLPADGALKAMKERARTLAGLKLTDEMTPLIDSLAMDPTNDTATATLAAVADSQTAHESADALSDRFAAIVDLNTRYLPALTMLVHRDCATGRFDRAAKLTTRACELMPAEAEPARLLASVYSSARRWDQAFSAATQWRNRSLDHPQDADLAMAAAQIELKHPDQAIDQLFPYLMNSISQTAGGQSSAATMTVELYLNALCLQDRMDQARAIAEPLANSSPAWRRRWLGIISITAKDAATGTEQLQRVEPLLTSTSMNDQLTRAQAWYRLGSRFNDAPSMQKALSVAEPLTDASPVPADLWLLMGCIHQQLNQLPEAELALGKAVAAAPDSAVAKNNLAAVMWLRKEDLHTAQQLATAAVALAPADSTMHCTLGEIDEQLNDLDAAKAQFEQAVRLNNENIEALIGQASVADRLGNATSALLSQIETTIQSSHPNLPAQVQDELQRLRAKGSKPAPGLKK